MLLQSQTIKYKWLAWVVFIILVSSLTFTTSMLHTRPDLITDIRLWVQEQSIWPDLENSPEQTPLIAVRQIYETQQSKLLLRAFLLIPCQSLCGAGDSCARHCQELITRWEGGTSDAKLMVEGEDLKTGQKLGRVLLDTVAPIELRYWSRRHQLIALLQTVNHDDHRLHLIKLQEIEQTTQPTRSSSKLIYSYQLKLGPFTGRSQASEGQTSFVDIDRDGRVELIAPSPLFAQLTPVSLSVPIPYRLGDQPGDVTFAPELIQVQPPNAPEMRQWLVKQRGGDEAASTVGSWSQVKKVFTQALLICLQGNCAQGEELIRFAYPQHDTLLRTWDQLKLRLEQSSEPATTSPHPFSILSPRQ